MEKKPERELAYYLTLFKIKGHSTWRAYLGGSKDSFKKQVVNDHHDITETMVMRIDRVTGTFQPL